MRRIDYRLATCQVDEKLDFVTVGRVTQREC